MAQDSPSSVDVQDIQFKLHDKFNVFPVGTELRSNVNLLTAASSQGLLFVGNPNAPELKVIIIKDLVDAKTKGLKLSARQLPLPSVINTIAASSDGNMLAVNYTLNGSGFLQIYSVSSFITPNIKTLYSLQLSPEENVTALQILWNPVLTNNLAVVLSNGGLVIYTLKDGGNFEFHSLDKQQQVKCGCWSPKGKQIVLGFPNGKLQQFKPDLTPAKTIVCPVGVHPGPFDTIAVHWLSTFQFVASFLQHGPDMAPSLYIVNAPKGGQPNYINYYDICYSATGPRKHQVTFTHIQQWNLLLVTSANGVEVGILGTKDGGESPTWVQYTLLDEARIEMPLTEDKDETYPIGFAFDTASSHQLTIGEQKMPIMPMIHVLSSHGHLVSFNFLNISPGASDVCSPPPPITDSSGQFRPLDELVGHDKVGAVSSPPAPSPAPNAPQNPDMSFAFNPCAVTSTPAVKEKPKPLFGNMAAPVVSTPAVSNIFGQNSTSTPPSTSSTTQGFGSLNFGGMNTVAPAANAFSGFGGATAFSGFEAKSTEIPKPIATQPAAPQPTEVNKPLYTVPATFTPPQAGASSQQQTKPSTAQPQQSLMSSNEIDNIVKQLIAVQINSFSSELQQIANQSKGLLASIGQPDEMKSCTKRLHDLQEIIEQANDRDFELDMQHLRQSLNESYAMLAECRTKLDMYNNPDITRLTSISTLDPINRRQLAKLQSYVVTNQIQLQQLQQQIDAQWSNYQDLVRRNSKTQMHIPCLDGIYQRMNKLKDLVARQRTKLNYIKSKLKQKGLILKSINDMDSRSFGKPEATMESLADSILSMSLAHVVDASRSKLSEDKLKSIRDFVRDRQIVRIKPQRPDRVGLKSEVILETKLQAERRSREVPVPSKSQPEKPPAPKVHTEQPAKQSTTAASIIQPKPSFAPTSYFSSPATATAQTSSGVQSAGSSGFSGFTGSGSSNPTMTFGQTKSTPTVKSESSEGFTVKTGTQQAPISFSAKVVSNETAKPLFTAAASTFAPAKSAGEEKKKPEETEVPKPFSFGSSVSDGSTLFGGGTKSTLGATSSTSDNVSTFGGLSSNKPSLFESKPSLFDNKLSSTFSFGGVGASIGSVSSTVSFTTATTSAPFNLSFGTPVESKVSSSVSTASTPAVSSSITTQSTAAPVTTQSTPAFSGFGKPVGDAAALTGVNTTSSSFGALNLSATTTAKSEPTTVAPASTAGIAVFSTSNPTTTTTSTADSLFGSLNICKPTVKDPNSVKTSTEGNVFAGFGGGAFSFTSSTDSGKPLFGASSNTGTFSFGATTTPSIVSSAATATTTAVTTTASAISTASSGASVSTTTTTSVAGSFPTTTTATSTAPTAITTSSSFSFSFGGLATSVPAVTTSVAASTSAPVSTTASVVSTTTPTVFGVAASNAPSTIFGSPAVAVTAAVTSSTIAPTSTTSSIFGGTSSFLGAASTTTPASTTTSLFGSTATATSTAAPSIFGTAAATTTFGAQPATTTTGNVFGGIPKPEQSAFGTPTAQSSAGTGLFAAAAAANPSPFGSPTAAAGGSIFGGGATTGFGAATNSGGSIFGGGGSTASPFGAPTTNTASGGSIFGGAAKPAEGANIFGSPTQPAAAAGTGSIFGSSTFGQPAAQSGGSIFGAAAATTSPQQQSGGGFGSSIFGGGATASNTGGSIFGGAGATQSSFGSSGFGLFSQNSTSAFGSPGGNSSFAQGGASVAQSGFGSPQEGSAFAKPTFGGAPTFGSPPAFGAQPSFGGAPTFGSPKGFGTFASPTAAPAAATGFSSPTQKNNLFEALGSTDTGLSFGNLAQNTNNAPKPTFGGSSFMNYRS